jgi:hypothetical protein
MKSNYRLRATLKTGRYHVVEGKSLENLKKKGTQLANEGAYGYIEHVDNHRVMFQFGKQEAGHAQAAA